MTNATIIINIEEEDVGVEMENPGNKFSFANQRVLLTYKTHINKAEHRLFIEALIKQPAEEYYCAHEKESTKTNYAHSHVFVNFGKRFQSTNCRIFDFLNIHPNIKKVVTKTFDKLYRYISKEDPELAELAEKYKDISVADRIWSASSLEDAINKNVKNVNDIFGVIQLYNMKKGKDLKCANFTPYGWQTEILEILGREPDDRTIHWWYEKIGKFGKTTLVKYLMANWPEKYYVCSDLGYTKDAAEIIRSAFDSGWDGHCFILNLPRAMEDKDFIYQSIEAIKDGLVTATKYKGKTMIFDCPHVVVFANWRPHTFLMSLDRWQIHEIDRKDIRPEAEILENMMLRFGEVGFKDTLNGFI